MKLYLRIYLSTAAALFFVLPMPAAAAALILSPASNAVEVGAIITETVVVSSVDQSLNAVSGTVSFPADLLQVVSISKTNSILSLWVQDPTFSNADGTISFAGVVPNPGYSGSRGQIVSIQFRGKKSGTAAITFSPSSEVLANDGNGTNILTSTKPATVTVSASQSQPKSSPTSLSNSPASSTTLLARITSSTHPDETRWYKLSHAIFDWTNAQGVSAVRLGYDTTAARKPSVVYTNPISHKELDLTDGTWYFSVQEKDSSGWGSVSTYRVQIDTAPPSPFEITFLNGTTTAQIGSSIPIQFTTDDELSGIDHYEILIDEKGLTVNVEEGSKPYAISGTAGIHTLLVRAYDKAGNVAQSPEKAFSIVNEESSRDSLFGFGWLALNYFSLLLIILAILGTLLFGAWYIRVHFSAYRRRLNRQLGITETHVHKKFDTLRGAITDEVLKLEKVKSIRELTHEEGRLITRFKKLLEQSEQEIEKEIEEIPR